MTRRAFLAALLLAGCAPVLVAEERKPRPPKLPPRPYPPPPQKPICKPGDCREARR